MYLSPPASIGHAKVSWDTTWLETPVFQPHVLLKEWTWSLAVYSIYVCSTPAYGVLVGNAPTQPNAMPAQVLAIPKMSA